MYQEFLMAARITKINFGSIGLDLIEVCEWDKT
jgi:hypothetical protein